MACTLHTPATCHLGRRSGEERQAALGAFLCTHLFHISLSSLPFSCVVWRRMRKGHLITHTKTGSMGGWLFCMHAWADLPFLPPPGHFSFALGQEERALPFGLHTLSELPAGRHLLCLPHHATPSVTIGYTLHSRPRHSCGLWEEGGDRRRMGQWGVPCHCLPHHACMHLHACLLPPACLSPSMAAAGSWQALLFCRSAHGH